MTTLYPLLFPVSFLTLLVLERLVPGRPQPRIRRWVPKALVFFALAGVVNTTVPRTLGALVAGHTLLDLAALGTLVGAVVGVLATSLATYWIHRLFHRVTWLWRWTHQLHHSAERVDIAGFAYTHPFEMLIVAAIAPITSLLVGVSPDAAMLAGYVFFLHGLFTHFAVATPRWLGYLVQRPEMHALHHARDVHAYNYGLPLWDMAFGTFRNPAAWSGPAGFWDGASARLLSLLLGRDVTRSAR